MMKDLTGKVIDMLEDSNLEAVKVRFVCYFITSISLLVVWSESATHPSAFIIYLSS